MSNLEQFDGLFMTALQQGQGINNFLDSFFGFLFRKTDFYADSNSSKNLIDSSYKKFLSKFEEVKEKERKKKQKEDEEKLKTTKTQQPKIREITPEEAERLKNKNTTTEVPKEIPKEEEKSESVNDKDDSKKPKEGTVLPGPGNGYKLDRYIWSQHLIQEININIPVNSNLRGKDITIKYDSKKLFVSLKDEETPIINGEFCKPINADTFVWTLEELKDSKMITITFEKLDQMSWWECCIKGEPIIDTTKINPEPSKLSDLDNETRSTVEKMMFDQRQKAAGLPTSDELLKQNQFAEFMKKHPEMDFSKCKFG